MNNLRPTLKRGGVIAVSLLMALSIVSGVATVSAGINETSVGDTTANETTVSSTSDGGAEVVGDLVERDTTATSGGLIERLQPTRESTKSKLRGANELLDVIGHDSQRSTLDQGSKIAEVAMKVQMTQLDRSDRSIDVTDASLTDVRSADFESPSGAAFAILDAHNFTPTVEQATEFRELDGLPESTRTEITDVLNAYLAYDRVTQETDSIARVRAAQMQLLEEVVDLRDELEDPNAPDLVNPATHATPVCLGGNGDNTYANDCVVLIEQGGDDTYDNNAGGATSNHAAALIDLSGSDTYNGRNGGGKKGGAGFLLDAGTSGDTYTAGGDGSLGKGTNGGAYRTGVGFLLDVNGSDTYEAGSFGTNGGASASNTDSTPPPSQAGLLIDTGNSIDTYRAKAYGTNGGAQKGSGFLFDEGGDDTYNTTYIGTNGGGWGGFLGPYGSGFLLDPSGDDTYIADSGAVNGGGYAAGKGFLLDALGADNYTVRGGSSDTTTTRGNNGGATGNFANGPAVGWLADLEGTDTYISPNCNNGNPVTDDTWVLKGKAGSQIDASPNVESPNSCN